MGQIWGIVYASYLVYPSYARSTPMAPSGSHQVPPETGSYNQQGQAECLQDWAGPKESWGVSKYPSRWCVLPSGNLT